MKKNLNWLVFGAILVLAVFFFKGGFFAVFPNYVEINDLQGQQLLQCTGYSAEQASQQYFDFKNSCNTLASGFLNSDGKRCMYSVLCCDTTAKVQSYQADVDRIYDWSWCSVHFINPNVQTSTQPVVDSPTGLVSSGNVQPAPTSINVSSGNNQNLLMYGILAVLFLAIVYVFVLRQK